MFTIILMSAVIIWALNNICKELGLIELAKHKIRRKFDDN
jgi:hypothetical protein